MNVLKLGVFLILSLTFGAVYAQTGKPIRGIVTDGSSGQPITEAPDILLILNQWKILQQKTEIQCFCQHSQIQTLNLMIC